MGKFESFQGGKIRESLSDCFLLLSEEVERIRSLEVSRWREGQYQPLGRNTRVDDEPPKIVTERSGKRE